MLQRLNRLGQRVTSKIPTSYRAALIASLIVAVLWWGVAMMLRSLNLGVPIWYDQHNTFAVVGASLTDPYRTPGYVSPPWPAILLAPLALLPLPLAVLVELCLYFAIITTIIYKFGGDTKIVLLSLLSFVALQSALELNIEWIVCLALIVPPAYSGPLLVVKPQLAFGYWLSFNRRDLVRALLVLLIVIAVSLVIWWGWPLKMLNAIQTERIGARGFNMAPIRLMPWPVAIAIGLFLSWRGFRRRDPILAILAWPFFVPYLTFYSLLLHFALFAVRFPRVALLSSVVMWIIMGGMIGAAVFVALMAR
jgi:hypothetical protein